jgi:hypothetical protein
MHCQTIRFNIKFQQLLLNHFLISGAFIGTRFFISFKVKRHIKFLINRTLQEIAVYYLDLFHY